MPQAKPLISAACLSLLVALGSPDAEAARKRSAKPRAPAAPTIDACSDFYLYANRDWLKANAAPAPGGSVSVMQELAARVQQQQVDLLDSASRAPQNDIQRRLGNFWASGLDEAAVERDGAAPVAPLLGRINAIRKPGDVAAAIAALHQVGIPVAFNFSADVDLNDLGRHLGYFSQGGLGLPDPAYYTRTDAQTRQLLAQYSAYVQKILMLTGTPADKTAAEAQLVIDLETRIARASRALPDLRSPRANYAPTSVAALAKSYRRLQLQQFLKAQGVEDDTVSLANPQLFAQLDAWVGSLKPAQWKVYLRWRVGDAMAPYLAKAWRDANFDFHGRTLAGLASPPERQLAVLEAVDRAAGPMLGHEYAARYLAPATRTRAEDIATRLRAALVTAMEADPRLGPDARNEARAKLAALQIEIGAPRRDPDFTVQPMGRGSFGSNVLIASTWHHREEMKRIGRHNAERRWNVQPQQPALAYDIAQNRLLVTAAILQAPVLDATADAATQYGAYGALVGRELSHAVDNQGRHVDAKGEVHDWWTPGETAAWTALGERVALQYGGYGVPGLDRKLSGAQVRDVAIADQAGLELAWAAFRRAQPELAKGQGQAFFAGWAGLWPQRLSAEASARRAASSVYAPGEWRTNGPLSNLPGFGEAYACKASSPMQARADQRIALWPALTPATSSK